jgi:hypothetical protein
MERPVKDELLANGTVHICSLLTLDYRGQLWKGRQKKISIDIFFVV